MYFSIFFSIFNEKNVVFFGEQVKKEIKNTLIKYLEKIHDKKFRAQINNCLLVIVKADFPMNYMDLYNFFYNNLKSIEMFLEHNKIETIVQESTLNFLKTLKIVLKEQSKKRLNNSMKLFYDTTNNILNSIKIFWDFINASLNKLTTLINTNDQKELSNIFFLLNLSKTIDKIVLFCLMCSYTEIHKE